jgi:hypothetical protein
MLEERRIREIRYDAATDTLHVTAEVDGAPASPRVVHRRCQVLLDAKGQVVGVDPGGSDFSRTVLLRGAFEDVARTVDVDAQACFDDGGRLVSVTVPGAKKNGFGS